MRKILNLRNVAKMTVACLAVAVMFISCGKDDTPSGGGTLGGSQSAIGQVGNTFSLARPIVGSGVSNFSAQVKTLADGVSTISASIKITNPAYVSVLSALPNVTIEGDVAKKDIKCRITTEGIQTVYPEGNLTLVKYKAKKGDVYTLKRGANTISRKVTDVSTTDDYYWGGAYEYIKVIRVEEKRTDPGIDHVEYITNHKFGLVGVRVYFEDGTSVFGSLSSSAQN